MFIFEIQYRTGNQQEVGPRVIMHSLFSDLAGDGPGYTSDSDADLDEDEGDR